jgi:lipopolysaccharide export system protein LptC
MASLRHWVAIGLLAAAAAATWYFARPPAATVARRPPADAAPLGYYLRGMRLSGTDETGRITYRIHADRAEELTDRQLLSLSGVRLEYLPADEVPWLVSATRASAPKNGSHLDLEGEVRLESAPTGDEEPIVIATTRLRVEPDRFNAVSDQPVELRIGDRQFNAVGLRAHLKDDTLELESEVHGAFVP